MTIFYDDTDALISNSLREKLKALDAFVYDEIFNWNVYELKNFEVKNQNVLDIGCHYGMFTLFAYELGAKQIVSIDANPVNFGIFLNNTLKVKKLKAINAAVTNKTGNTVTIDPRGCQTAINTGNVSVGTISLKDAVESFPQDEKIILKMDIEGAEYNVIKNAPRDIFNNISIITMEIHGENIAGKDNNIEDLINYILNLGYNLVWRGIFFTDTPQGRIINNDIVTAKFIRI